jgi:hypothetical protein
LASYLLNNYLAHTTPNLISYTLLNFPRIRMGGNPFPLASTLEPPLLPRAHRVR